MDNASKALIMAASVLLGLLLLSMMIYVFRAAASIDENYDARQGERELQLFNSKFEVFDKNEIEELWNATYNNANEEQKAVFIEHYGSIEEWKKQFLHNASTTEAQKSFAKIVEWYGGKEKAIESSKNPHNPELVFSFQKRIGTIMQKLADKMGMDVNKLEVQELIGEYEFVSKQMYQIEDASKLMLELAAAYQTNELIQKSQDSIYGKGATNFIGQAIEAFYCQNPQ